MKKEDSLYLLIQSLSSHEKRLFKVYVSNYQNSKSNNYLRLFDIIDKMKTYDEEKVKQKLGNTNTAKNLPQSKKYLKDIIIKSMRTIDDERPKDKVVSLLKEQHFLNKKNLFKEQWKKLQKAKEIASQFEIFDSHLEILDIEMLYLNERKFDLALESFTSYKCTKTTLLQKLSLYNKLIVSKNFIFHLVSRYRNKIDDENLIIAREELNQYNEKDIDETDSFIIRMWYYNISSNYYLLANDTQKQFDFQQKIINLFDEYPHFKQSNTRRYLILYFNYIGAIFKQENYELLKEKLDDIAAIEITNNNDKGEFFQNYTLYRLLYAMNTNRLEEAMAQSQDAITNLDKHKKKINASSLLTLYYNYALIFFFAEDFDNAIIWLEKIKDIKPDVRKDLQAFASVLTIICHYEMDNYFLIESLCRSTNRGHELSPIEKTISNSLKKLASTTAAKKLEIWQYLKATLDENEGRIVGRLLISFWIDSHLGKGKSIRNFYEESVCGGKK